PQLRAREPHRRGVGAARRADHHRVLRHRVPDRAQGLRRRDRGRPGELPAGARGRADRRPARIVLVVLGQCVQGSAGLHADHSGAVVALAEEPPRRGRGMTRRQVTLAAVVLFALAWPWLPDYTVTQLAMIGLYAMVAAGLVMLTGVGGMTSFGQAAFVGLGAYATSWVCTAPAAVALVGGLVGPAALPFIGLALGLAITFAVAWGLGAIDRKSTRLNSSHSQIS